MDPDASARIDRQSDRPVLVLIILLVAAIALVLSLAHRLIDADRAQLVEGFATERFEYVEVIAREVGENLDDILHDLRFASPLLASADGMNERQRILETLVASERGYVAAVVVDEQAEVAWAHDPRISTLAATLSERMIQTTRQVLAADEHPSPLETSGSVVDEDDHSLRVFAVRFKTANDNWVALALLVDVEMLFEPLRLVSSDPQTRLLVVGPREVPSPASDETLARSFQKGEAGGLAPLVLAMREKRSGRLRLSGQHDDLTALESTDYVAAFASIPGVGAHDWTIATLTSLSQLRAHERQIMWRLYTVALIIIVMLVSFGVYVVRSFRRRGVLHERLRNAWEIAHLNEKSDKILERIPATVFVVASDGTITDVNHPVGEHREDEFIGEDASVIFPAADGTSTGSVRRIFDLAMQTRSPKHTVEQGTGLFGEQRHYNVYVVPLETGFDDAAALIVFEDITELVELEHQLLHAEKLATVGELAAGIAHEVGTPLGVARGRAELLLDKLKAEDDPRQKHARIVIEQIDQVRKIIEGVLDFTRKSSTAIGPVPLRPAVTEIVEFLRIEFDRVGVSIESHVPEGLPPIAADDGQLRQVLVNLLTNARDASQPDGVIRVAAATSDGSVRIVVSDNGAGIPEEQYHRIFDPFFTTKKRGKGTGLGLWVVMQILGNHKARIDIESSADGTAFEIHWPVWSSSNDGEKSQGERSDGT